MSINKWKKLSSKIVYKNSWYRVREDKVITPSGKEGTYSVVEQKQSVFIVATTDKNELYLVDQYRYPTDMESLEVPGGGVEELETPLVAAKRELQEETGLTANSWEEIGFIQLENGISNAIGHIFVAKGLQKTEMDKKSEDGIDNLKVISYPNALQMVKNGQITDSISVAAIVKAALYLGLIS